MTFLRDRDGGCSPWVLADIAAFWSRADRRGEALLLRDMTIRWSAAIATATDAEPTRAGQPAD